MPVAVGARRYVTLGPDPIQYPVGVEQAAVYEIRGPDGIRAVINNPNDRDFVGYLLEPPSGLERAGVRENADTLAGADGGLHGDFLYDRLAFTLHGFIYPDPQATSFLRQSKVLRATNAMRADATLLWTPAENSIPVQVRFRQQQPTRITQRRPKEFLIAGVSEDPGIYSQALNTTQLLYGAGTSVTATNNGTAQTWPVLTLYGPWTNPTVANSSFGGQLDLTTTIPDGHHLTIDTSPKARSIMLDDTTNTYSALVFATSQWFALEAGDNTITADTTGMGAGASLTVDWRDRWG